MPLSREIASQKDAHSDDRIVPMEQSLRLADELPDATLNVIAQSEHLPHEEKPLEFMQAIVEFLSKLEK